MWAGFAGLSIDANLFATNATNEKFHVFTIGGSFGFASMAPNQPRMDGLRIRYRFGD